MWKVLNFSRGSDFFLKINYFLRLKLSYLNNNHAFEKWKEYSLTWLDTDALTLLQNFSFHFFFLTSIPSPLARWTPEFLLAAIFCLFSHPLLRKMVLIFFYWRHKSRFHRQKYLFLNFYFYFYFLLFLFKQLSQILYKQHYSIELFNLAWTIFFFKFLKFHCIQIAWNGMSPTTTTTTSTTAAAVYIVKHVYFGI